MLSILARPGGARRGEVGRGPAGQGRNLLINLLVESSLLWQKSSYQRKTKAKMDNEIEISKSELQTRTERVANAARVISEQGFGSAYSNEQIEELSGYSAGSREFAFFVSSVRAEVAEMGMWLSGEGQDGKGFFVVRPSENAVIASRFSGKAYRALQLMQTLLERTPLDALTESERKRHEKELRELKYSNRLFERRKDVIKVINKHSPGLLKDDIEIAPEKVKETKEIKND